MMHGHAECRAGFGQDDIVGVEGDHLMSQRLLVRTEPGARISLCSHPSYIRIIIRQRSSLILYEYTDLTACEQAESLRPRVFTI